MNENIPEDEIVQNVTVELPSASANLLDNEAPTDVEEVEVVPEATIAELDPMAALLANLPHKARHIAEMVIEDSKDPKTRTERTEAEVAAGLPGRVIQRSMKEQMRFLRGRFEQPGSGKREQSRRLRQAERRTQGK